MIWKNMNKANKTLLTAAVLFFFFLCLHIQYPESKFAEGLLFCAEAALVGGIADWFAVTAIFEKPLGFPWHTAILPRRREAFIEATGKMLQQEFFSRKKLISKVRQIDFAVHLVDWLKKDEVRQNIITKLLEFLGDMQKGNSKEIAASLKRDFDNQPVENVLLSLSENIKDSTYAAEGVKAIANKLKEKAASTEFREKVEAALEEYKASKLNGSMAMMMAGMAQSMNLVNIPEAAMLVQEQSLVFLDKLSEDDSTEQQAFIDNFGENLKFFAENEDFKQELRALWQNLISQETIEKNTEDLFSKAFGELHSDSDGNMTETGKKLYQLFGEAVDMWIDSILSNSDMHKAVNGLFYDVAARSMLQAQDMLGEIVKDVLSTLTDKQINHLVYDKVEPDLLWIRMNGSIVGASIGACIFIVLQLF